MKHFLVLTLLLVNVAIGPLSSAGQAPSPSRPQPAGATGGPAAQTQGQSGSAVIRGRITAAESGMPIRRAQVRLSSSALPPTPRVVGTDDQGRYEFAGLPAGRYSLQAARNGYVSVFYGQRRPRESGVPIELKDGQAVEQMDIALPRGSVIIATVTDEFGDPFDNAQVYVLERNAAGALVNVCCANASTDDHGRVRLSGLLPGDYVIAANPNFGSTSPMLDANDSGKRYAATYYPGTTEAAEATTIRVGTAQEVPAAFAIVPARTARVTGSITRSSGAPLSAVVVSMTSQFGGGSTGKTIQVEPDGTFSFSDVLPGDHSLTARPSFDARSSPGSADTGRLMVRVAGADVTGLLIDMAGGATLRGRIVIDEGQPPSGVYAQDFAISIATMGQPAQSIGRLTVHDDWTFEMTGVSAKGTLRLRSNTHGYFTKSVVINGKDVIDTPTSFASGSDVSDIEVVITRKVGQVTGTVTDARNAVVNEYVVLVFPEDRERWGPGSRFQASGRPDQTGSFKINGLPPGRYYAAAISSLQTAGGGSEELLNRLQATAARFTIGEGETRALTLRLIP